MCGVRIGGERGLLCVCVSGGGEKCVWGVWEGEGVKCACVCVGGGGGQNLSSQHYFKPLKQFL